MRLITEPNFHEAGQCVSKPYRAGDDFYEALIEMHGDLDDEQSNQLNARLILLLSNHIGDLAVLKEAIQAAKSKAQL